MREPTSTSDDPTVPGPAPRSERTLRRRRIAAIAAWTVGALLLAAVVAGFFVHLPYVIISPGSASPVDDSVVTIEGAPTYGNAGNLLYLTVRVSGHDPNLWKYLLATIDPDQDVEPREDVVGCLSDADNARFNAALMSQSQDDATKVALERLGYTVTASAPHLVVTEVCRGVPASGALHVDDEVLAIGGTPVTDGDALVATVDTFAPGDAIPVTVARDGAQQDVDVPTGEFVRDTGTPAGRRCADPGVKGGTGEPCFGIALQAFVNYQFPITVEFDLARIGGPSAGLAFTLAIIDDLTPGDLTGRRARRGHRRDRPRRHRAARRRRRAEGDHGAARGRRPHDRAALRARGSTQGCGRRTGRRRRLGRRRARRPATARWRTSAATHDDRGAIMNRMSDTSGTPLVPSRDARLTPDDVAERSFSQTKRGYAETEVRAFLRLVADELAAAARHARDLAGRVTSLEERLATPAPPPSDQDLIAALGEETARVLGQAREAAVELRTKAEEHAQRLVKEAQENARQLRATTQQAVDTKARETEDAARVARATRSSPRRAPCATVCSPTSGSAVRSSSARSPSCARGAADSWRPTRSSSAHSRRRPVCCPTNPARARRRSRVPLRSRPRRPRPRRRRATTARPRSRPATTARRATNRSPPRRSRPRRIP